MILVRIVLLALLATGLDQTTRADESRAETPRQIRNDGYSLLYQLCTDERQLDLILIIKTTPPDVADYAKRISALAGKDCDTLEKIQANDPSIRLDLQPLPQFEMDTRASIRDDKQHAMLFGTKGAKFAHLLLLSQVEAATYGLHLAKVLAEKDPAHAETLNRISTGWQKMRHEAYGMLDAG